MYIFLSQMHMVELEKVGFFGVLFVPGENNSNATV